MKKNPVLVLGGVLVFGATLMWGQGAMAYGPQWRPAQIAPPAPMRAAVYPRVANIPSFRPAASFARAQDGYADRWSRAQPRYFRPHSAPRRYVDRRDTWDQRRAPPQLARVPMQRFAPSSRQQPTWSMMPTWSGPVATAPMPPSWGQGYGAVAPMTAAYPARVPVVAAPVWNARPGPGYQRDRWPVERAPTAALMPRMGTPAGMVPGGWRPVPGVAPTIGYQNPSAMGTLPRAGAGPLWRHEHTVRTTAGSAAAPRRPHQSWRPARAMTPQLGLVSGFRPLPPASPARTGPGNGSMGQHWTPSQRPGLPAWATTYDEPRTAVVCDWCNGI